MCDVCGEAAGRCEVYEPTTPSRRRDDLPTVRADGRMFEARDTSSVTGTGRCRSPRWQTGLRRRVSADKVRLTA